MKKVNNVKLYTPGQVAKIANVTRQTVTRWCNEGLISFNRLPSGHFRIPESEVKRILNTQSPVDNSQFEGE